MKCALLLYLKEISTLDAKDVVYFSQTQGNLIKMDNSRRNLLKTLSVLPLGFMQKKEDAVETAFRALEDNPNSIREFELGQQIISSDIACSGSIGAVEHNYIRNVSGTIPRSSG